MNYTEKDIERFEVAFDLVKNQENWKGPIKSLIHEKDLEALGGRWELAQAIIYYTGSIPVITKYDTDLYLVEAEGFNARHRLS